MAFKKVSRADPAPESPQALLQDLKGRKIAGLLDQQGEVLRNYIRALKEYDVAIQMPTGSGKTLVGLLIAEWRRRKYGEKAVYLCPTKQLVLQVANASKDKFALLVEPFVGSKQKYTATSKTAYRHGDRVAITTYASLFNSNPFFDDPDFVLLDDAHSAENYIASNWSLDIRRSDHGVLFTVIVNVLADVLSAEDLAAIEGESDDSWNQTMVQKIPTPELIGLLPSLRGLLDEHCDTDDELKFRWIQIKDRLDACHLYISPRSILIRPLIPPTWEHGPFANAKQRVYMSATLGAGGDLERLTGRPDIHRLDPLEAYEKRGVGRRFFIFPESSLEKNECTSLVTDLVNRVPRALYLVPDSTRESIVREWVEDDLKATAYDGSDLEQDKGGFVNNDNAVCVAASRYDGIDLAHDECRLLIVDSLPSATNLQERFFVQRMAANALLSDRILTRVVQAFGRCTRADTDYAAVVVLGEDFQKLLASRTQREQLHPELQAEVEFGTEQSKAEKTDGFLENFDAFWEHDEDWDRAEAEIRRVREETTRVEREELTDLSASVANEIEFQQWLWAGDYASAVGCARRVLASLNDPMLRGYRGLWSYLAGSAATLQGEDEPAAKTAARQFFSQAAGAAQGVPWLHRLSRAGGLSGAEVEVDDTQKVSVVVERMQARIESFGMTNDASFVKEERFIHDHLRYVEPPEGESEEERQARSNRFEDAQCRLGSLLGYVVGNSTNQGAPDPWWVVDDELAFVFEDNVGAKSSGQVSAAKARQVAGHPNWLLAEVDGLAFTENAHVHPVLVTPCKRVHEGAAVHLNAVAYWGAVEFCEWGREVMRVVRQLRDEMGSIDDLAWRDRAIGALKAIDATPETILAKLQASSAATMLT
ncbi:MAG: DEAD/DEAH box helicase [Planctomycetota bacterium]